MRALAALLLALVAALCWAAPPPTALGEPFLPPLSAGHPLGTDDLGRDSLALLAQGGRQALLAAGVAVGLALLIGVAAGVAGGMGGDVAEAVAMRAADVVAALPVLLLAILLAAASRADPLSLGVLLGLARWPLPARLVRAEVAALRRGEVLRAAVALGVPAAALVWRHVLPVAARPALASAGVLFGWAVATEAALGFVGLSDPTGASWGQAVAHGFGFLDRAPWMWWPPALALALCAALAGAVAAATPARLEAAGSR